MANKVPIFLIKTIAFPLLFIFILFSGILNSVICGASDNSKRLRVGSELDFPPYASQDKSGELAGFSIDLIRAVSKTMGLSVKVSTGTWDNVWQDLVAGELDVLPIVAQSPERKKLVDFSLPHTETYDAFFVKKGSPVLDSLSAAQRMEIVTMRSDAAHHELLARNFEKNLILVDTIPEGLALIASGKHDAFLCSKLIGTVLIKENDIKGVYVGPPIQDYKRIFSFAVTKGNAELLEKLNQGLLIVKTNGEYDRIYDKWLTIADPWRKVRRLIFPSIITMMAIILIAAVWIASLQRIVKKQKRAEEKLRESEERFRKLFESSPLSTFVWDVKGGQFFLKEINNTADTLTDGKGVQFLGISANKIYHDRPDMLKNFLDCITEKQTIVFNTEYLSRGTGLKRQIIFTFVYISDEILMLHAEDITERVLAEKVIYEKDKALRLSLDAANAGTWTWDIQTGEIIWDDQMHKIFDLKPGTFDGVFDTWKKCVHPDDVDAAEKTTLRAAEKGEKYDHQYRVKAQSGEWRVVNAQAAVLKDDSGKPVRMSGFALDITESEKAEEKLRQSEEMFRALFEQAGGYCMILDPNTPDGIPVIIDANKAACAAHGYTREEFIGQPVADIDDENGKRLVKKRTTEIMTGEPFYVENVHVRKDGTTFPVAVNAKRIDIGNSKSLILTTEYDITERKIAEKQLKESQERFKLAMEAARDGLYDWNLMTNQIYYSPGWKRMLGYQPDELPDDFSVWQKLTKPEYEKKSWELQQELVNKKRDRFEMEFKMKHKDGHWVDILSRATAVFDEDGKAVRIIGTHVDITERKRLEANLLQAQKMESIGTLAGGIAHDFNNILGAILGYAEMVQEDSPAGSMVRNDIDQVVKASHRAKDLVKQILAFSRQAETDHIPLQPEIIIKEALKMICSSLPTTIDIQQDIDPEAGLILADPTQIHQIITNLCTNAFHAMEETGGTLTISLKNTTLTLADLTSEPHVQPGHFVEIIVEDTGPGIPPEIMDKIFDPYFTSKEVGKGTGMGLAIIHGIAKKSNGFVSCKSSPGEGTIFHVYLPVYAGDAPPDAETTSFELIETGVERVLFIDDEEMLAEMGKTMLKRLGYKVTIKTSSIEALTTIQNQQDEFDLVITDQTMPGMTGSDLARRILQIRPGMPIILCTGFSNMISEEKARMYGIKGFAMKPLAKKDLATLIRKVLDGE